MSFQGVEVEEVSAKTMSCGIHTDAISQGLGCMLEFDQFTPTYSATENMHSSHIL